MLVQILPSRFAELNQTLACTVESPILKVAGKVIAATLGSVYIGLQMLAFKKKMCLTGWSINNF